MLSTNRRGFLKLLAGAAVAIAIEVRLARAAPVPSEPVADEFAWGDTGTRYSYGIDKSNPLTVVIQDRTTQAYLTPNELMEKWQTAPRPIRSPMTAEKDDEYYDAIEATAIIAMSQGKLLYDRGMTVIAMKDFDDLDDDDAQPCTCLPRNANARKRTASVAGCAKHSQMRFAEPYIMSAPP